jgi:hypothetical protein
MKADESRSAPPTKHQLDHKLPTVIHHPEEEMPVLARWVHRAMENPTRFWGVIGAVVAVTVGLSVLGSGLKMGRKSSDEAWTRLESAKTPAERVEIANEFPATPAGRWALLQAATEYYHQGFNDLPRNSEAALLTFKKALDLFQKVAAEAPEDSPQARAAAFGLARTLEARNDLAKAVAQYEKVARTKAWAGTEEAREAERLARELTLPGAIAFYKELYEYKPAEVSLPPGGVGNLNFPLPAGHPPVTGPGATAEPNPLAVPPPPPSPAPKGEAKPPADSLPLEIFTPAVPGTGAPKTEPNAPAPKAEAPKPPGLPGDPFSTGPGAKPDAPK